MRLDTKLMKSCRVINDSGRLKHVCCKWSIYGYFWASVILFPRQAMFFKGLAEIQTLNMRKDSGWSHLTPQLIDGPTAVFWVMFEDEIEKMFYYLSESQWTHRFYDLRTNLLIYLFNLSLPSKLKAWSCRSILLLANMANTRCHLCSLLNHELNHVYLEKNWHILFCISLQKKVRKGKSSWFTDSQ